MIFCCDCSFTCKALCISISGLDGRALYTIKASRLMIYKKAKADRKNLLNHSNGQLQASTTACYGDVSGRLLYDLTGCHCTHAYCTIAVKNMQHSLD